MTNFFATTNANDMSENSVSRMARPGETADAVALSGAKHVTVADKVGTLADARRLAGLMNGTSMVETTKDLIATDLRLEEMLADKDPALANEVLNLLPY